MSEAFKMLLENIEQLSTKEKALAAHCLLSSMDPENTQDVDKDWLSLAESRSAELESGAVQAISWDEIKKDIAS
tara:strand:+ start:513 stop:734 length:222 start_codon:yes stop_codon:yes gene_type:complete